MVVRIALDCVGGEFAPGAVVSGACKFWREVGDDVSFVMFGDSNKITELLESLPSAFADKVSVVHSEEAGDSIIFERPISVVRRFERSSIRLAVDALAAGDVDCIVSAGDTGVLLATSKLFIRTIHGILRPAMIARFPTSSKDTSFVSVLDVGANVDCDALNLFQFGVMGCAFARAMQGLEIPRLSLLNVGSEPNKGNDLVKKAHKMINESFMASYYGGFVEPDQLLHGGSDVVVCDGFTGNVALKAIEGAYGFVANSIRNGLKRGLLGKVGQYIFGKESEKVLSQANPDRKSGAILIGLNGIVAKAHGSAKESAIYFAIKSAYSAVSEKMNIRIAAEIAKYDLESSSAW